MQSKKIGYLSMVLVVIIYGVSYISRDVVSAYMAPVVLVGIQLSLMAILFTLINILNKRRLKMPLKEACWLCFTGLFGTSIFQMLTTLSVKEIGPDISSLLFGLAVVFALVADVIFNKRPKTKLSIVGVVISLIGVYILMDIDFTDLSSTNFMGYVISIGSVLSWVIYCFLSNKASDKYEKTVVLNYQALAGALTTIPFIFVYHIDTAAISTANAWPVVIMNLVILGVFNATGAKFLNMHALKSIGVTMANLMLNFLPVVTVVVGFILYGTMPSLNQIIGGLIIIVSVVVLNKDQEILEAKLALEK